MTTKKFFTGMTLVISGVLVPPKSFANIDWHRLHDDFDIVVDGTKAVASTILPIVGDIVSVTGHPEVGKIIHDVSTITTTATTVVHDIENHTIANATIDTGALAAEIAAAAHDKKAERVINNINHVLQPSLLHSPHASTNAICAQDGATHEPSVVVVNDEGAMDQTHSGPSQGTQSSLSLENQQHGSVN